MKWLRPLTFVFLMASFSFSNTTAQSNLDQARDHYRSKTLLFGQSFWTGYYFYSPDSPTKRYIAGGFFIPRDLEALLLQSSGAKKHLAAMKRHLIGGNILFWGGIGMSLGGLVTMYAPFNGTFSTPALAVSLGVLVLGIVFEFIGGAELTEARNYLMRAVWEYNHDVTFGNNPIGDTGKHNIDFQVAHFHLKF